MQSLTNLNVPCATGKVYKVTDYLHGIVMGMNLIKEVATDFWRKRCNEFQYQQVQHQIQMLHHEIDQMSIELGKLIKKKCELEIEMYRKEST